MPLPLPDALIRPERARAVPWLAAALFALHLIFASRYGVFRDELYYVACGKHLAFGYVDHPPLVAWMARVGWTLFGDSVRGLRVIPALCAAATVLAGGELARCLGGGGFAQVLTAICIVVAPEFLGTFHILSMNCVLPVAWTAASVFAVRALVHGEKRAWIGFGVACGVGLLAKHSTLFFGVALVVGLLATPHRRALATRGPWIGLGVAALLFAPNVVWEQLHGWPTLEFMHNAQTKKMVHMGAAAFVRAQVEDMLPLTLPVWAGGAGWLLAAGRGRPFRFLGVAFVAVFAIVLLANGKPYYLAPAFPVVYAAGGVAIESWLANRAARAVTVAVLLLGGAAIAPMALPVLDPPAFIRYASALGSGPAPDEKHDKGLLPQFQADQHGWEAMATKVGQAYERLSPEEKPVATVYGGNYGEAGACDFFGPRWGLPPAVSAHNNYFLWGPPAGGRGAVMIAVADGTECDDWTDLYEKVEEVGRTDDPYAMPYETHVAVCILRRPKKPLAEVWPRLKHFI